MGNARKRKASGTFQAPSLPQAHTYTIMVRLDITVENKSPFCFTIHNRADDAESAAGVGTFSGVPARAMRTMRLMPRVDACGVKQGITGHFELKCTERCLVIPFGYAFSTNQCAYAVEPSDARVLTQITYLGKSPASRGPLVNLQQDADRLPGQTTRTQAAHRILLTVDISPEADSEWPEEATRDGWAVAPPRDGRCSPTRMLHTTW